MFAKILLLASLAVCIRQIQSHGMMLEPPNRSSLWRFNSSAPPNYDDNQNFCGGAYAQWDIFGGKCGVCGDRFDEPHPQANENTGTYGQGTVVRTYQSGSMIDVGIKLTKNHMGYFLYSLCVLEDAGQPESGEECFQPLNLGDGTDKYNVDASEQEISHTLQLPEGLNCKRCVLRWHYNTGNSWGDCGNGTLANGCGPQETFRSCADVAIL